MNKFSYIVFLSFFLLSGFTIFGQRKGVGAKQYRSQKHLIFGIGASNFLGDLGGRNTIGTHLSPVDLEFPTTRPSFHLGYRFRFSKYFASTTVFQYAILKGDDALTNEPYRRNRNLRFRTHLFELSERIEFLFYGVDNTGYTSRYRVPGLKGKRLEKVDGYVFSGITGFAYIPQGPANGGWENLRPLKTEGQGLPGGGKSYGPFSWGVPIGIGFRIGLDPVWLFSVELSYTQTFTDYLDDVSGVYYDNDAIRDNYGSTSAYFADPSSGAFPSWTSPGELRGDANHDDGYMFLNFSLIRDLEGKSRKRVRLYGRRKIAKF